MYRFRHILIVLLLALYADSLRADEVTTPNLVGRITCNGAAVSGVVVSDGVEFTTTDSNGYYALCSKKYEGVVFFINPSGYEPDTRRGVLPKFWAEVDSRHVDKVECHNFTLRRRNNTNHRMIFFADLHLSSRNEDLMQMKSTFIPMVRRIVAEQDSVATYSILLGDLSSCQHWYSAEFDVGDALSSLVSMRYPTPLYTVMGEQDYDGSIPSSGMTDHNAERVYVSSCGPRYYSMNFGRVHYVVLDNTIFRNEPGDGSYPTEIVGKRNYDRLVGVEQLAWLRRDLALVEEDRPIVVCMHHWAFRPTTRGGISNNFTDRAQLDSLTDCFSRFGNVHFYTAHNHRRRVSQVKELPNIVEHNIASASGNTWTTFYDGFQHICPDGTEPGAEVFSASGNEVKWEWRGTGERGCNFRLYDMRSVGDYYRRSSDVRRFVREYPQRIDYGSTEFEEYLYINWWGDEPGAKLEVWRGDHSLGVRSVMQEDPLSAVAIDVTRLKLSRKNKPNIRRNPCSHLYRVKVEENDTLRIRTTDRFGQVFEKEVVLPIPFHPELYTRKEISSLKKGGKTQPSPSKN